MLKYKKRSREKSFALYIVVQRNSFSRDPNSIPRTSRLDSSEHILRAEVVGTPFSSVLESFEQSI